MSGYLEFRIVIVGVISMFILNGLVGMVLSDSYIQEYDQQAYIDEVTSELSVIEDFFATTLLNVGLLLFSLFGVDFIVLIDVVPTWFLSALVLYNTIVVFALLFYLIERIWVG